MQEDKVSSNSSPETYVTKREVCLEKFRGNDSSLIWLSIFEGEDCTDYVPIYELVTMIVTSPKELSPENLRKVFEGIATYYPRVPVIFASNKTLKAKRLKKNKIKSSNVHGI